MKTRLIRAFALFALTFLHHALLAQPRLDIAFEGPWVFYQEPKFALGDGKTLPALIAVAPVTMSHFPPTFSTGDGFSLDAGIYCVGFDGACKINNLSALTKDGYADPSLLQTSKGTFNWALLQSDYVLILPMPDSYSADGQYAITLHQNFPSQGGGANPGKPATPAIGIELHYVNGPQNISLLGCPSMAVTASNCNSLHGTDQVNSGTLRISMKSTENPMDTDKCDYHVRNAYHQTLLLIDSQVAYNTAQKYINVPKYDSCAVCDPQQDQVPAFCPQMVMDNGLNYSPAKLDIPGNLNELITTLKNLDLNSGEKERTGLIALESQAKVFNGKSLSLSQLKTL